jgi:hypothetical protein
MTTRGRMIWCIEREPRQAAPDDLTRCDLRFTTGRCSATAMMLRFYGCMHEHALTMPVCAEHIAFVDRIRWNCSLCDDHVCPAGLVREEPVL